MLTSLPVVMQIPGMSQQPSDWISTLLTQMDAAIKKYLKQNIEQAEYTEFYSGDNSPDLVLNQMPVWSATTTIAAGSNGVALPTATLNVASTTNFPTSGTISVQSGISAWSAVTYTGKSSTTFTGCSGGTGTLATGYDVGMPVVYLDYQGYSGQNPDGFQAASLVPQGNGFMTVLDKGGTKSNRGILKRLAGSGTPGWGWWPYQGRTGKLAGSQLPYWQYGQGNIKVIYTAGYATVPEDLAYACAMLVAYAVRSQPQGGPLQSETLGAYSYSILQQAVSGGIPELGSIARTLAPYRDSSW